ncbi:hypothetical protein DM01DRAFT_1407397 [Hesseltinella vesiculosa]|uniref:Rab-GAP TBC domain-containing protein n=1 Tax=Hesseltinella vesiculosa TaxID=101127 RepID=A0A1X2GIN4_9FUNG|nr:hypothetical protein DM01DRAFT_1407397 [Hesseltinella vesiculosa]
MDDVTTHTTHDDSKSNEGDFELHDYDLDVVDEALADPNRNEYSDHFGFRIQVKTDDELSDDTSDDETDDDLEAYIKQRSTPAAASDGDKPFPNNGSTDMDSSSDSESHHHHQDNTTSLTSSITTPHSSDEDEYSVDTTLTTPTAVHKSQRLSLSSVDNIVRPPASLSRPDEGSSLGRSLSVQRPSQAYRERQTKRMSVMANPQLHSPLSRTSSSSVTSNYKRLSTATTQSANTASYLERLKSKIMRSSTDADQPSARESPQHIKLRQRTLVQLETQRTVLPMEFDWDFWKACAMDMDHIMAAEGLALRHHLSIGIPAGIRGSLWQLIAKSQNQSSDLECLYSELSKRTSLYEKSIQHDLDESTPLNKYLLLTGLDSPNVRHTMVNLLKAYSLFDPDIGYHQALAFILMTLLQQVEDETAVFGLLVQLTGFYGFKLCLDQNTDHLEMLLYRLDHFLQMTLPDLHRHMEAIGVKPEVYAGQWLTTGFAFGCPVPALVTHVMDLLLVEGITVLERFILSLFKRNHAAMMDMGYEHLVAFLQGPVFDVYKGQENQWVIDMYQMDMSPKMYVRLERQYQNEMTRKNKQRNDDEAVRQANDQLMNYLQDIQEKYRVLELEHQEVTRQAVETKMAMAKLDADNDDLRHQLTLVRHQFETQQRNNDNVHQQKVLDMDKSNTQLSQRNTSLQDQITDLESVLISLKMKYAEREQEYDSLRRELYEFKKSAHLS